MLYKNNKTGNIYKFLNYCTDATNGNEGVQMVIYQSHDTTNNVFVREKSEFFIKFTPVT